ncbi:MAG TPA: thioredoxin-dependent thiol peroxidase [Bacteroidetes bacterium]|nr:thioredoxin-dependent thiol peroxidase [Bacteroidota bacterium]
MTHLVKGDKAPDFEGIIETGKKIKLSDYKGKKLILYFYPKDFTSGCTLEAENLSENFDFWKNNGYDIIGISPDSVERHVKFKEKHNIPYHLIADTEKEIATTYGVYGKKKMYGREYMGIFRTTFVIDEEGTIVLVVKKVKTKEHTEQLKKLLEL